MTTDEIQDAIDHGYRLDSGNHYVTRTLMLGGDKKIRGRVNTKLVPAEAPDFVGNTLIWAQSMHAGIPGHDDVPADANEKGLPRGGQIEDVMLYGRHPALPSSIYGLWVQGAQFTFRNFHVVYFHHGVCVQWGVDNVWSRCVLSQNYINVELRGTQGPGGETLNSVTTQHFYNCNFRQAIHVHGVPMAGTGFWARTGDRTCMTGCIYEANAGAGLYADFGVVSPIHNFHPHFEKNGTRYYDAGGKLVNFWEKLY